IDGRTVGACGIGSVFVEPSRRGQGCARLLIETILGNAAREGAEIALLFSVGDVEDDARAGFQAIPQTDLTLRVTESTRHGAPMTMVRGGEDRDLAAIAAMGRTRAAPFRFHLDRDVDFLQHAITKTR